MTGMTTKPLDVYVEVVATKAFASAVGWPGWCRAGRNEEAALAALAAYADRYAEVAHRAGLTFNPQAADTLVVVERAKGGSTTAFGAPECTHDGERLRLTPAPAKRLASLLAASWSLLDDTAAVTPASLRKGPRGGGRDRDKMLDHVLGAETAYARKLGVKHKQPALDDSAAIAALRADILAVIGSPTDGGPITETGWTTAYAARRIAWHVLDHVWEMRDRTE